MAASGCEVDGVSGPMADLMIAPPPNPLSLASEDSALTIIDDAILTPEKVEVYLKIIPTLVHALRSDDKHVQMRTLMDYRRLVTRVNPTLIDAIILTGVITTFVDMLKYPDELMQFEAAWVLTNVTSGTQAQTDIVVESGAIPVLVILISSTNENVRLQAVWTLGNIAGGSVECRDHVSRYGVMNRLVRIFRAECPNPQFIRIATWTMRLLCSGKPRPQFDSIECALVPLARLIHSQDLEVVTEACWALSGIADGNDDAIQAIISSHGVVVRMIELLAHECASVAYIAVRTIGGMLVGNKHQTQFLIDLGVLPPLHALFLIPENGFQGMICWAISNIMSDSSKHVQAVVDAGFLTVFISLYTSPTTKVAIKTEITWIFGNMATTDSIQHVRAIVSAGCLKTLCDLLETSDEKTVFVLLTALKDILENGETPTSDAINEFTSFVEQDGGYEKLKRIQQSPITPKTFEMATSIIDRFFPATDLPIDALAIEED